MEIIISEIDKIKNYSKLQSKEISNDQAFNYLIMQYFCYQKKQIEDCWYDISSSITDGTNDGGMDFVYFDEDDSKLILGQNKYTSQEPEQIASEIRKMLKTLNDFEKQRTGNYHDKLKKILQNELDRLGEDNEGNIQIIFSSINNFDEYKVMGKIKVEEQNSVEEVIYNTLDKIEAKITMIHDDIEKVSEAKIEIDKAKNWLKYSNDDMEGIFVNVSSSSIIKLFNKYKDKGLFDLNLRKYIKHKVVDDSIKETLDDYREEFWFLNNGLTIACEDFIEDGNKIKLYDFSIVNGGQTTNLIGSYKGNNDKEFFIPCKIVKKNNMDDAFFSKIAEATNSQKPIQPKDLKSNAPEMTRLKKWLEDFEIHLEIKRGEKFRNRNFKKIKNDELAQLIYSFVNQKPGTARSNKNSLFANPKRYSSIFRQAYEKDRDKKEFLVDLIKLNFLYNEIVNDLKKTNDLNSDELNILNNAKQTLFGLFGVIYHVVNNDYSWNDVRQKSEIVSEFQFVYSAFLSNYKEDDIKELLESLIKLLTQILNNEYEDQFKKNNITSVSNFFKTDKKYVEDIIVKGISAYFSRGPIGKNEFLELSKIFKRNDV